MLPRVLRPASAAPKFTPMGYSRLWAVTNKAGAVSGSALSETGSYAVKWWDGSIESLASGGSFSKSGSGRRAFEIYPTAFSTPAATGNGIALYGQAQISTTQSKFGGASARFGSSGSYGSGSVAFNWSMDWTLEFWLRRTGNAFGSVGTVFSAGGIQGGVGGIHIYTDDEGVLLFNDAMQEAIYGGYAPLDQWVHVAAVRASGTNTLYVDGSEVGTSNQNFTVASAYITVGGVPSYGFYSNCYLDELRLTQSAIYSGSSFTPPSSPLSAISGTALLLHFDSSSAIAAGAFDGFSLSSNGITRLRAESVTLGSIPGFSNYYYHTGYGGNYVYIPPVFEQGNVSNNLLDAAALDLFYADLLSGSGALYVEGNPGIVADTPSIATSKGYTVYGSTPP